MGKISFWPIKVIYKNDTKVHVNGPGNSLIVKNIGTIKPKHWAFEKEYRFLALANHDWNSSNNSFEIKVGQYYSDIVAECIDIGIDNSIFNKMEVRLGPSCEEHEFIIVDSLLKKYTKNGDVQKSELRNKIKI